MRWFKPAKFAGRLGGLSSLKRKCQCPKYFKHESLIGKEKTSKAAKYPKDLVLEYAKLFIKAFRTVLELEWWRHKQAQSASELNQVKQNWAQSKERMAIKKPVDHKDMSQLRGAKRAWNAGDLQRDQLPQGPLQSKKARREDKKSFFIGGMRNPYKSLKKMTILQEAGNDMARAWNALIKDMPQALEAARTYGSERCELDPQVLDEWVMRLNSMMKVTTPTDVDLKGKYQFRSPLKPELWEAWQRFSKDPEKHIADWAQYGAPLGRGAQIPRSNGVFPPVEDDSGEGQLSTLETQLDAKNYKSVYDDREGAQGELDRLVGKGFAEIVPMTEIREKFRTGTVSKLALIAKIKPNGTVKHRLIIDLLRSGGNSLANIPERIVLPRVQDVVKDIQELWQQHGGQPQGVDWGMELVGADLSDAYCHFGVAPEELCHCLAPSLQEDKVVVFKAMSFGYKGAPLIMGRLAAALTRQWQAMVQDHARIQTYMDDPLMVVCGSKMERESMIAQLLYSARAFGVNLSYEKGERGASLTWIGVQIAIDVEEQTIVLDVPAKLVDEVLERMKNWQGMVSIRELRAVTGKLSWRSRWAVSICYGTLAGAEREAKEGVEQMRGAKRTGDTRPKTGLIPVKRLELARRWLVAFLQQKEAWRCRKIPMQVVLPKYAITTDASPFGVAAILSVVDKEQDNLTPTVALAGQITKNIATALGIEFRQASGQAVLEAFAVLLAVRYWKATFRGAKLLLKADSMVALALSKKLSSSTATLNFIGAELSMSWKEPRCRT